MQIDNYIEKNDLILNPIPLLQETEFELSEYLLKEEWNEDSTDGPLNFIEHLANNLLEEFNKTIGEDVEKKVFLKSLTKIFVILLIKKADSVEKIKSIIKIVVKTIIRLWQGRRLGLRHNRPKIKKPFKIKTILPEQKTVQIKKNGNVIKNINVRRTTTYFNDRWARTFF